MGVNQIAAKTALMNVPLAGHLRYFQNNWEVITKDSWVLRTVSGYKIAFIQQPWQRQPPRKLTFAQAAEDSLRKEIINMESKHAISEITPDGTDQGFYSQLFLVPKKDGGQRPVINLKKLNSFTRTEHFKMEGIHILKDLLKPGDWMAKVDLKDAYFMVPMAQEDKKFLRFRWKGRSYQFNCLPFSLSPAPWVFTKTTRPVAAALRELGL